jgi:hypothetical protein
LDKRKTLLRRSEMVKLLNLTIENFKIENCYGLVHYALFLTKNIMIIAGMHLVFVYFQVIHTIQLITLIYESQNQTISAICWRTGATFVRFPQKGLQC